MASARAPKGISLEELVWKESGLRGLGFRGLGFRVLGFRVWGFGV